MHLISAAVLGIVQGLTEFLPISSSAHLIVIPWLLGWTAEGLAFDVALHIGTSASILVFFRKDWMRLGKETVRGLKEKHPFANADRKLVWYLVAATIPAAAAGIAFEEAIEEYMRSPLVTVFTLVIFGLLLLIAEKESRKDRTMDSLTWFDSICIGIAQAIALIPGVSRSGVTITAALFRNCDRTTAARFSFLLSTPVIVGAGFLETYRFIKEAQIYGTVFSTTQWPVLVVGVAASSITGFFCIRYFLKFIQSNSFKIFVIYRCILACIILIYYIRL